MNKDLNYQIIARKANYMVNKHTPILGDLLEVKAAYMNSIHEDFLEALDIAIMAVEKENIDRRNEERKRIDIKCAWIEREIELSRELEISDEDADLYYWYGNRSQMYTVADDKDEEYGEDWLSYLDKREIERTRGERIKEIAIQAALEGVDINIIASFKEEYLQLCEYAEFDDVYYQTIVAAEGRNGRLDPRTDYESYHRYKVNMQDELDAWADDNMSIIPYSETNVNPQDWSEFRGVFFETK